MTRATNLTTQEAVLLSRQILLLRADIVGGAQKPLPEQWARDAEKHIGRVVTYAQMRAAAESLGFGKRDLWASGRDDSRAAAEKAAALVASAELRLRQEIQAVGRKADGTDKRLGILHTHIQARDAGIAELRNTVGLLIDRIGTLHERIGKLESEMIEQQSGGEA